MGDLVSQYLQERIDEGDFPSAVYLIGQDGEVVGSAALGKAVVEPEVIAADTSTIYDLASLTKPLVTGLLTALFIQRGLLSLDHRVSVHLGEFDTDGKRMITIGDLVSHTSHLPAWRPFYLLVPEPSEVIGYIGQDEIEYRAEAVVYGDPNFLVLAAVLERLSGLTLDRLAEQEVFRPLGLADTYFNPPQVLRQRIAASENGNGYEFQTCIDLGYDVSVKKGAFRSDVIWGEVHDGNAWFLNGVAGHAGLFSTVNDVYLIAQQFLPQTASLLDEETCKLFTSDLTPGSNESRSLAFQLASTTDSTASSWLSPQSFGHLGFTGTSLWLDPASQRIFILLTNRTHAHSLPLKNINSVRRKFHELAVEEMENK